MQRCFFICPFVIVTDILRADRKLEVHVEKEKGGGDTTNVKLYRLIINIIWYINILYQEVSKELKSIQQ